MMRRFVQVLGPPIAKNINCCFKDGMVWCGPHGKGSEENGNF